MLLKEALSNMRFTILMTITACVHSVPRIIQYRQQTTTTDCVCASSDVMIATVRPSAVLCASACKNAEGCVSFSYNIANGTCIDCRNTSDASTPAVSDGQRCWNGIVPPRDCLDVLTQDITAEDGVYQIVTWMGTKVDVYCKMSKEGGGWTVMLNRFNGEVQFNRTFTEYEAGFGDKTGEHWLGLRHIHEMTASGSSDLQMLTVGGLGIFVPDDEAYEEWSDFSVGRGPNYTLDIGYLKKWTYHTLKEQNMLNTSLGLGFSAKDIDRDLYDDVICSNTNGDGGWWFAQCTNVNPTGMYMRPGTDDGRSMYNVNMFGHRSMTEMTVMFKRRV